MTHRPFHKLHVVGFLVAVMLTALPSAVSTAHAAACTTGPEPFPLCGTNTISTTSSGSLRVSLPAAATLSALNSPGTGGVQITGGGRLAGLIIQPSAAPSNHLYFTKPSATFGGQRFDIARGYSQDASGNYSLVPGNYTLYVITDGSPTTITLSLGGISGSKALSVQRSFPLTVDTVLAAQPLGGNTLSAQGAKAHSVTGANSLLATYVSVSHPSQVTSAAASCQWVGTPPPEANTQPFCPGADNVEQTNPTLATQPSYYLYNLHGPVSAGAHGLGGYAVSASNGGTLSILGVWLTLNG